ncbi:MAG: adenylate/guanylate cyclase domain-containing protein [Nocardioides sp.]|nr:adenylate/guanylate cyclase domain-containing protein [Nocardioides sp.]
MTGPDAPDEPAEPDEPDEPDGSAPASGVLERAILGEPPSFNAPQVAEQTGVTMDEARRLWRALGFPEHGLEAAYTDADTEALSTLIRVVRTGLIDFDMAVNLTRAVGQTMARLADWEVATLVHRVEELEAGDDATGSRIGSALRLVDEIEQPFEELLVYVWRRHLAAAIARVEALGANEEDLNTVQLTVGFADIVSFTALSNRLSEDRIGDLVELFESRCADVVAAARGRVIKSIGDSVLFVNDDPVRAYDTAEGIINVIGRDSRMPDVRVGLASGSVVMRLGDVFGPPVNLASRLTAVARRNRIIIDQATADLLPGEEFETRALPARPVRGFGIVEPVAVRRA